jgi:formylglycine-generating enzyme required for sulfatase activity
MRLVRIPAGTFRMGSPDNEADRSADEQQHEVEISQPFYLGIYPVTQEQYQKVMGGNPSYFSAGGGGKGNVQGMDTRAFPVEQVSWDDAVEFCRRLSELPEEEAAGRKYRLPTEAEWEYSCRGGAFYQTFHFGNSLSSSQANFDGNYPYGGASNGPYLQRTCKVGSYPADAFGLFDLHGNVWEWCSDWYAENYYANSPRRDPAGPPQGSSRVFRGGGWDNSGFFCRSADRHKVGPASRRSLQGFRVALVPSVGVRK